MKERVKMYLPVLLMLLAALTAGILIWLDVLDVSEIIEAVEHNKALAAAVIIALYAVKGVTCIPYAAILVGCALIFELPMAILINVVGTVLCISISYLVGRFSKGLTFDGMMEKYPKFKRYFTNAQNYSFTFVFAVHTLHLSMEVQGVLFGLLRTRYLPYIAGSMTALIPSMLWFTVIGDEFDLSSPAFWILIAVDIVTMAVGLIYAKKNIIDGGKNTEG